MNKIHKYIAVCLFTVLFTITRVTGFGQDVIQEIKLGFAKGDTERLTNHMSNNIDLSFDQQKSIYSKSQALSLLKQRFDNEPPKEYKIIKSSDPEGKNVVFLIAEYQTNKATYLIYLSLKKEKQGLKISEIHFESQ